jgi:hypothetical protein
MYATQKDVWKPERLTGGIITQLLEWSVYPGQALKVSRNQIRISLGWRGSDYFGVKEIFAPISDRLVGAALKELRIIPKLGKLDREDV